MSPFLGYLRLKFDKKAVNWFKNIPSVTKQFARGLQYGSGRVIQKVENLVSDLTKQIERQCFIWLSLV